MKIENRADPCPCIWVDRFDGDVLAGQHLDQISQIHHSHLMRNTLHQCDIMADKADGDILFPLQPGHVLCFQNHFGFFKQTVHLPETELHPEAFGYKDSGNRGECDPGRPDLQFCRSA